MLITTDLLSQQYDQIKADGARLKAKCAAAIVRLAAQSVDSDEVIHLYRHLGLEKVKLEAAALLAGIGDFAKTAEEDPFYDVVAELTSVAAACASVLTWIETNFPSANGYLLAYSISDGTVTQRSFTTTQTAGLRTQLQTVVDTIG